MMGWDELAIVIVLAIVIIGPTRLPEYAAKLARGIRQMRVLADGAKAQLREQMGPEFDDVNWRQYDPRQYDPRKIVRDALREPIETAWNPVRDEIEGVRSSAGQIGRSSADGADSEPMETVAAGATAVGAAELARNTPYDADAT